MSNTFIFVSPDNSQQAKKQAIYRPKIIIFSPFMLLIAALALLVSQCQCRDTVLLASLSTKTDQILFRMLKQTNYLFKSNRVVNGKELTCYSIVKNELTLNQKQTPIPLNYSINHKTFNTKVVGEPQNSAEQQRLYKKLDSILNILNGLCLYYRTTTFISEYCHKEHFRQYDDDFTKFYNQKQKFQDFYLGFYSPYSQARARLKHSDGSVAPQKSTFKGIHLNPLVSDVFQVAKNIEMQQNTNGKLVHSTSHIIPTQSYIAKLPVFLELNCFSNFQGTKKIVKNYVITATPFDFIYTKKQGKCDQFINATEQLTLTHIRYEKQQKLRIYQQFLYGDVEQICTQNWRWQGQNKRYEDSQLKSGSTLYLEYVILKNNQIIVREELVVVKHVHSHDLVQLQKKIGISFNTKDLKRVISSDKAVHIQKIAKCQVVFDEPLATTKKYENNQYIGNNLAILDENLSKQSQQSVSLGCICHLQKHGTNNLIDMKVVASSPLWLSYYRIYMQTKTFIYEYSYFKDTIFTECQKLDCYEFDKERSIAQLPKSKYTQITKIGLSNKVYNVTQNAKSHIYVVSIQQSGTLRLVTKDSKGNVYYYILSEGQIIKIRQFENGTKEIIKQNKYYENSTRTSKGNIENYIFIHCFLLSNGSKYGAIWKYKDYIHFPRFVLADQQLVSFQYRSGYAYLRKINPQKMKNKQALVILSYQKLIQKQYAQPEQKEESKYSIFLDKSYTINYTYEGGDYCGPPINKKRTTLVTLKCGKAWFKIEKVFQTVPCSYFVQVQTLLLCRQNTKDVVQSDELIGNKIDEDKVSFSGVTCLKEEGIYNKIAPLSYPGKKLLG